MSEAWDAQKDRTCVSLWGLWAWGLSFGYALSDALLRIVLWGNASPTSWRKETWPVLVLAAAAAIALLLHLRRDRRAALALSAGAGLYGLLDRGLYLHSTFLANANPEALRKAFQLLSSPYWWIHQILWLPLLAGGYLALRRSRRAWPLLCASAAGALYLLSDTPALWHMGHRELQSPTILALQVCDIMGYASIIAAFLFAWLDVCSPRPVRFGVEKIEPDTNDERSEALKLRKRLSRLLLAGMILFCLNEFFGAGGLLSAILSMTLYDSLGRTGVRLLPCILPCAAFLYSLRPLASPKILMAYTCWEAFVYAVLSAGATLRAFTGRSMMVAIGLGEIYFLVTMGEVLLTVLFLAVLHTARRLDGLSCPAGAKESSLAWCAYAVSFLYPLADCVYWVMRWIEFSHYQDSPALWATLSVLKVLLAALFLSLFPRRDRHAALAASAAAGASFLLNIAYNLHWVTSRGELQSLLLSGTWWAGWAFPAALIVGGYLALRRVRWAPFVLTASAVSALWLLWGYVSSLSPDFREIDVRTTLTIFEYLAPLFACIPAWLDRR